MTIVADMEKKTNADLFDDMVALIGKHGVLTKLEILAIAAHMTGQLWAMQDDRFVSNQRASDVIAANLKIGHKHATQELAKVPGNVT